MMLDRLTDAEKDTIIAASDDAADVLIQLWKVLIGRTGRDWDSIGEGEIDPAEFSIHYDDSEWAIAQMSQRVPDSKKHVALMLWMNNGPSTERSTVP